MTIVTFVIPLSTLAQNPGYAIFDSLSKVRSNLKLLATMDDTLTVGTIDVSAAVHNRLGDCFKFDIPVYTDNKWDTYPNPDKAEATVDGIKTLSTSTQGGIILLPNKLHLNIRFKIVNWQNAPTCRVWVKIGNHPVQQVQADKGELVFLNVSESDPEFSIGLGGFKMRSSINNGTINIGSLHLPGLLPFRINTGELDLGGFQIPVVPVTIVYVPPVDSQKLNRASFSTSTNRGVQFTMSFTTQNSKSGPTVSTYYQTQETQEKLNMSSAIMEKIQVPAIQAIASGLKFVSQGLGTTKPTTTNTTVTTDEHSFKVAYTQSATNSVDVKQGGPGIGDQFVYLLNPKFLWMKNDGKLSLTLIDHDGLTFVSAQQLKDALERLKDKPADIKDDVLKLNSNSIQELLKLDPFVSGGANTTLPPERFRPYDYLKYNVGSGGYSGSLSVTTSSEEKKITTKTTTFMETDTKGLLSAIGLGIDEDKVIQSTISQSNIVQSSNSDTFKSDFTFNGNGQEYYSVEIYFDVVFGAFAFRDVTLKDSPQHINMILKNAKNKTMANVEVLIVTAERTVLTKTDSMGNFKFQLPNAASPFVKIISGDISKRVKLQRNRLKGQVLRLN